MNHNGYIQNEFSDICSIYIYYILYMYNHNVNADTHQRICLNDKTNI
jgi:hypothetical protein